MKKAGVLFAAIMMGMVFLTGCGESMSFEADEDTVFITKNGDIKGYIQSDFSENYYDQDELMNFIDDSVTAYVAKAGEDTVKLEEFKVEENIASAMLSYASVTDYADFNGVEFYAGGVIAAQADGYKFKGKYLAVEDGKLTDTKVKGEDFMDDDNYKCVIIGQQTSVSVSGDIVYVSENNVEVTGKRTARVSFDPLAIDSKAGYIIYKK